MWLIWLVVSKLFTLPSPPGAAVLRLLDKLAQRRNVGLGHRSLFDALQASGSTHIRFQCFKEESIAYTCTIFWNNIILLVSISHMSPVKWPIPQLERVLQLPHSRLRWLLVCVSAHNRYPVTTINNHSRGNISHMRIFRLVFSRIMICY